MISNPSSGTMYLTRFKFWNFNIQIHFISGTTATTLRNGMGAKTTAG